MAAIGIALLTAMDGIVKGLNGDHGAFQIVLLRFATSAVMMAALVVWLGYRWPAPHRLRAYLIRAGLTLVSTAAFFYALGHMPLAELFALSLTAPVFASLFAALFLGEPIRRNAALAILAGLAGMAIIVFGGGRELGAGSYEPLALVCALAAPITYAITVVLLRAQTAHEPVPVIVAFQAFLVAAMASPAGALEWVPPSLPAWGLFVALGLLGSVGHLALTSGIKRMSTIRYSVVEYTGLLWATALGYLIFAEVPRPSIAPGAALIIAACLLVARGRDTPPRLANPP
jgi:S-adenosylmethionine uptake transporter